MYAFNHKEAKGHACNYIFNAYKVNYVMYIFMLSQDNKAHFLVEQDHLSHYHETNKASMHNIEVMNTL